MPGKTFLLLLAFASPAAAAWQADLVTAPGPVAGIEVVEGRTLVQAGAGWHQVIPGAAALSPADAPVRTAVPEGGLPDGRVATGLGAISQAWLADPTDRYRHAVLGDAIEAGSLVVIRRDGRRFTVALGGDAVFEDLMPRIARLGGVDRIVVVKSYLARGSAIAVVDPDAMAIVAENPPVGHGNAWLSPAGIAEYDGRGEAQIAFVRQPHVLGRLELWSWRDGGLVKTAEVPGVGNHHVGSRALGMSWTADFDGDGHPDLAIPAFDRSSLRILAFAPGVREIARVPLPGRAATNIGPVLWQGRAGLLLGLEDGRLFVVHDPVGQLPR